MSDFLLTNYSAIINILVSLADFIGIPMLHLEQGLIRHNFAELLKQ